MNWKMTNTAAPTTTARIEAPCRRRKWTISVTGSRNDSSAVTAMPAMAAALTMPPTPSKPCAGPVPGGRRKFLSRGWGGARHPRRSPPADRLGRHALKAVLPVGHHRLLGGGGIPAGKGRQDGLVLGYRLLTSQAAAEVGGLQAEQLELEA